MKIIYDNQMEDEYHIVATIETQSEMCSDVVDDFRSLLLSAGFGMETINECFNKEE